MTWPTDPRFFPIIKIRDSYRPDLINIESPDKSMTIACWPESGMANVVGLRSFNDEGEILITHMSVGDASPNYEFDAFHISRGPSNHCFKAELGIVSQIQPLQISCRAIVGSKAHLKLVVFWDPFDPNAPPANEVEITKTGQQDT